MKTEQIILNELLEKLNYKYIKANTKSKRKTLLYDLFLFSHLYNESYGLPDTLVWEKDTNLFMLAEDTNKILINSIYENQKLYNDMALNSLKLYQESNFIFYNNYGKQYHKLNEKNFQEIIFSFLNSLNPQVLKQFKEKINNNEIFKSKLLTNLGATYPISSLNKNIILYSSEIKNTIYSACTLIHELGHNYEINNLKKSGINYPYPKILKTPFYEVSAYFFEYSFIEYLIENKIYSNDTPLLISDYYDELLINIFFIAILNKLEKNDVNKNGYIELKTEEIINYANNLKNELNIFDINTNYNVKINYTEPYVYGIGRLFGIYLYHNYKENPQEFFKNFNLSLLEYFNTNNLNSFNKIGITEEKLTNGDILKKTLQKNI